MGKAVSKVTDAVGFTDSKAGDRAIEHQQGATDTANRLQQEQYNDSKNRYKQYIDGGTGAFNGLKGMANSNNNFSDLENPMQKSDGEFSIQDFRGDGSQRFGLDDYNKDGGMRFSNGAFEINARDRFGMEDMGNDGGYQFRLREGLKGVESSAAARGSLNSGATLKALAKYGQNYASNEYDKAHSRYDSDRATARNNLYQDQDRSYNRFNNDLANYRDRGNSDYTSAYNRFNNDSDKKFNRLNTIANYGNNANSALAGQGTNYVNAVSGNMLNMGNARGANELSRLGRSGVIDQRNQAMEAAGMAAEVFCWAARAIFGIDNPKWLQARHYIKFIGPKWFKKLYLKHGEVLGEKIKKSPVLKAVLRPLFEYFAFRGRTEMKKAEINHAY